MRLPDFIGLGGMRCGSTTLWQLVRSHPSVFTPAQKELHFFENRDGFFDRGVQAYAEHFADAPAQAICGESTPEYLSEPDCAQRIHDTCPDAKLFVVLRDPVARAWSHYTFMRQSGRETKSFAKALDLEPKRLASNDPAAGLFGYLQRSDYAAHLQRFDDVFGPGRVLVILLEDIKADLVGTTTRVLEHIGVQDVGQLDPESLPERANYQERHPRWIHWHKLARSMSRWRYPDAMGPIAKAVRKTGRGLKEFNLVDRSGFTLGDAERTRLTSHLAPGVRALDERLGRPTGWCADA